MRSYFLVFLLLLSLGRLMGQGYKLVELRIQGYQAAFNGAETISIFLVEGTMEYSGLNVQGQAQDWQIYPPAEGEISAEDLAAIQRQFNTLLWELRMAGCYVNSEVRDSMMLFYCWENSQGHRKESAYRLFPWVYKNRLIDDWTEKLCGHSFYDSLYRLYD